MTSEVGGDGGFCLFFIKNGKKDKKKKNFNKKKKNLYVQIAIIQIFLHFCGDSQGVELFSKP